MRALLQHVLPPGLQKVRYYGWMSPNNRLKLQSVCCLVWLYHGWAHPKSNRHHLATRLQIAPTAVER